MNTIHNTSYSSPIAYLVLTDSSQLTADGFEKLPDQIMYPYAEKNLGMTEANSVTKESGQARSGGEKGEWIYHVFCTTHSEGGTLGFNPKTKGGFEYRPPTNKGASGSFRE
uniref:(California timema) hypothetical protein n=1 Tax=Timema californicum TaxID=61474 RepID=A0A7R9J0U9_TIMCA|nr:unnamed protein product [Timema californicum]